MGQAIESAILKTPDVEIVIDDIPAGILRSIARNGGLDIALETARKYGGVTLRPKLHPSKEPWIYADHEYCGDSCYIHSLHSIRLRALERLVWAEHLAAVSVDAICHKYQLSPRHVEAMLNRRLNNSKPPPLLPPPPEGKRDVKKLLNLPEYHGVSRMLGIEPNVAPGES